MTLDKLTLYDFRNYKEFSCDFAPGVNLIVGNNAQGKTNLLEAVTYLSTGKSFRTRKEEEMIRFEGEFSELRAELSLEERKQELRALLFRGRKKRELYIGGVKQKNSAALHGIMPTVLFCPEDLLILKSGSAGRRKLIDDALCQLRPAYESALTEYQKLLEHKSRILKDYREIPSLLEALPEFNERMAVCGAIMISFRAKYLRELQKSAAAFHSEFSGGKENLSLNYQTVSTVEDPFAAKEEIYQKLKLHQEAHYRAELESGQCLSGPHKDDFSLCLQDLPIKSYGSQGQVRTATISLKLAERELILQDTGENPLLLLDDVLSELDDGRQDFLLNRIHSGQVFITCCEKERMTEIGKVISIENGAIAPL